MSALVLLCACLALGVLAARFADLPQGMPAAINFWVLKVALPALVLVQVPRLQFDASLLFPALAPWIVIGGAAIFSWLGRLRGWSAGTVGALVLSCGLGNTAFMGLPMIEALRGPAALGPAIIADQLGSFLALSTAGVVIAARYAGGAVHAAQLARRVLLFPAFIALIGALLVRAAAGGWPPWCTSVLARLGDTLTPLSLFSVGLQFRFGHVVEHAPRIAAGLFWKLLLAPLIVCALAYAARINGIGATATILQCAMAPMISAGILAEQHGLDPPLANAVVSIGILVSLLSVPLWNALL